MPEFQDRSLVCLDCRATFIWTAGEQSFYFDKGLTYQPRRCKDCKAQKNAQTTVAAPAETHHPPDQHIATEVRCANCGVLTTVPFQPTQGRPVYCRTCFSRLTPKAAAPGK